MLNKVMIIGRLGRDPELKYTQSGMAIARFGVATDESYTDRDGKKVERTEWHNIVVFQRVAENCCNFLSKGSLVYVEGSLQTNKWQDQQGQDRYSTEIKAQRVQFLDRKGARDGDSPAYHQGGGYLQQGQQPHNNSNNYGNRPQQPQSPMDEDLGSPFPSGVGGSEMSGSGMDDVPF